MVVASIFYPYKKCRTNTYDEIHVETFNSNLKFNLHGACAENCWKLIHIKSFILSFVWVVIIEAGCHMLCRMYTQAPRDILELCWQQYINIDHSLLIVKKFNEQNFNIIFLFSFQVCTNNVLFLTKVSSHWIIAILSTFGKTTAFYN